MSGEDVYDVAKKAEDWEVGECPYCMEPYTRCDCPEPEVAPTAWNGDTPFGYPCDRCQPTPPRMGGEQ